MRTTKPGSVRPKLSDGRRGPPSKPRRSRRDSISAQLRIDRQPSLLRIELKSSNPVTHSFAIGKPATYKLSNDEERKLLGVLEQIGVTGGRPDQRAVDLQEKTQRAVRGKTRLIRRASARKTRRSAAQKSIEEILAEIAKQVPIEEWDRLPSDLSENLDHYLYGAPRR